MGTLLVLLVSLVLYADGQTTRGAYYKVSSFDGEDGCEKSCSSLMCKVEQIGKLMESTDGSNTQCLNDGQHTWKPQVKQGEYITQCVVPTGNSDTLWTGGCWLDDTTLIAVRTDYGEESSVIYWMTLDPSNHTCSSSVKSSGVWPILDTNMACVPGEAYYIVNRKSNAVLIGLINGQMEEWVPAEVRPYSIAANKHNIVIVSSDTSPHLVVYSKQKQFLYNGPTFTSEVGFFQLDLMDNGLVLVTQYRGGTYLVIDLKTNSTSEMGRGIYDRDRSMYVGICGDVGMSVLVGNMQGKVLVFRENGEFQNLLEFTGKIPVSASLLAMHKTNSGRKTLAVLSVMPVMPGLPIDNGAIFIYSLTPEF